MKVKFFVILIGILSVTANANENVELPLYMLKKMNYNESDPSSKPELMMRQFEYLSTATPKQLLDFYENSEYVKSCKYNDMADNYLCELNKYGKISSGHVFIPYKSKKSTTTIFVDYFYFK